LCPRGGNNLTWFVKLLGVAEEVPIRGSRDQRIAQIAGAQRGLVASRQLAAAGISSSTVSRLAARSWLCPIHRAVFAVGHRAPIELGDETAALLAVGGTAALSHGSAAALWGLLPPDPSGLIHLTTLEDHRRRLSRVVVHQSGIVTRADLRIRSGLPVLSPACALLDIAELVAERRLELAVDRALVDRIVGPHEIRELLARTRGRHAATLLAAQLARLTDGPTLTRSEAEELFLALIRQADLPAPRVNTRLHGYEVDFHWAAQRCVAEIDGFRFHSTRRAFEHDRRKDAVLQAAGISVLRFTWRQMQDEPFAVIARLAALLARA
jgi:very-short-patch-repair endonuclease